MSVIRKTETLKLPKTIEIKEPSDFVRFEELLRAVCEKYLSHDWDWSFRVGGLVQQEIKARDPENEEIKAIENGKKEKEREDEGEKEKGKKAKEKEKERQR